MRRVWWLFCSLWTLRSMVDGATRTQAAVADVSMLVGVAFLVHRHRRGSLVASVVIPNPGHGSRH